MKKVYEKPAIIFESFALSENIAANCESIVGNPSKGSCAVIGTGNIAMFDSGVTTGACIYKPEDLGGTADMWDGACYHVPTEYNNLFNS